MTLSDRAHDTKVRRTRELLAQALAEADDAVETLKQSNWQFDIDAGPLSIDLSVVQAACRYIHELGMGPDALRLAKLAQVINNEAQDIVFGFMALGESKEEVDKLVARFGPTKPIGVNAEADELRAMWIAGMFHQFKEICDAILPHLCESDATARVIVTPPVETEPDKAAIVLNGRHALVLGKECGPLTAPQSNVLQALLAAGRKGLSKDELVENSGHTDAVNVLKRLFEKDSALWAGAVELAGIPGGRYKAKFKTSPH